MPNLDNKGPGGLGPKTGKKLGKCRKNETEKKEIEEVYSFRQKASNTRKKITNNK